MLEKLVTKFVDFQIKNGNIQKDDSNVYRYGYTLMLEIFLNVSISIAAGCLLGRAKEVLFLLCVFIPLRSFCGGYHAQKAWQCILLSNFVVIGSVFMAEQMMYFAWRMPAGVFAEMVLFGLIVYLSPIESVNKTLSDAEKKAYKRYAASIMAIEITAGILIYYLGGKVFFGLIIAVHIVQAISLAVGLFKNRYAAICGQDIKSK